MIIKNKKGMEQWVLVSVLLVIIFAAVFIPLWVKLSNTFFNKSTDKACSFSLLLSSATKIAGKTIISPECEHKKYVITQKNITENEQRIDKILQDSTGITSEYDTKFIKSSNNGEWYVDEFMAKELKKCWDNVGRGTYDLFDEWWTFLDCSDPNSPSASHKCSKKEDFFDIITKSWYNRQKVPTFCILCSSVNFEKGIGIPPETTSLKLWLANNAIPRTNTPYGAYLTQNTFPGNVGQYYEKYSTAEQQAVLYIKKQNLGIYNIATKLTNFKDYVSGFLGLSTSQEDKVNEMNSIQYTTVLNYKDLYNECSYLIG